MRTIFNTTLVSLSVIALAVPAAAQATAAAVPGRVELGINGAGVAAGGSGLLLAGPQVTLRLSRRHALQFGVDAHYDRFDSGWSVDALYTVLYRYTFAERGSSRGFLLAGAANGIGASHREARTYTSPARAFTNAVTGVTTQYPETTYTHPERSDFGATVPRLLVLGVGAESQVARRLVLQGQVAVAGALWGVGLRAAVGLHVPLGRVTR